MKSYAFGELGLKPSEYYALTEKEYLLMCEGYRAKEIKELRLIRRQCWIAFLGYADPKKAPKSEIEWWPIGDEKPPVYKRVSRKKLLEAIKRAKGG